MPSRRFSRGRTALRWAIATFVGVQLTASVLLDYVWPRLRCPALYEQADRVAGITPRPNVVFLGSSRTGCLITEYQVGRVARAVTGDPAVQCANAFVPAGDPVVQEQMLHLLLERGVRPRFAVIEVAPDMVPQRNAWLGVYCLWVIRWHDLPAYAEDLAVSNSLGRFAASRLIPLYTYREQVRLQAAAVVCRANTGPKAPTPLVQPVPPPSPPSPAAAARWRRHVADGLRHAPPGPNPNTTLALANVCRVLKDYRPGGTGGAALERLLQCCRDHGIEPILLRPPLSAGYRGCHTPAVETAFADYVARLTQHSGCHFADYFGFLPDTLFVDHHHAAAAGNEVFSPLVGLELIAPAWTGSTGSSSEP